MKKIVFLMGLILMPALVLGDGSQKPTQQKQEVQQGEGTLPPRTLIIRVKLNAQGEEENTAEAIASNYNMPVVGHETAIQANKSIEGMAPVTLCEKSAQATPSREMQMFMDLQEFIAIDPLNKKADSLDASNRWNHYGSNGFYGYGHRGNWGYRSHNRFANYGYWYNNLLYPYTNYGYYYPYGGYNNYYYSNPYYY